MAEIEQFLVYENWQAEKKAMVHKGTCSFTRDGHLRIQSQWLRNNSSPNDRWLVIFQM